MNLNFKDRQLIQERDRNNTLELANYGRKLSGKSEFKDYDEYKNYIAEDEFIIDAEIDQSLKIIVDIINQES